MLLSENVDRFRGVVINFLPRKGYGFIHSEDGAKYFVHYSDIRGDQFLTLTQGEEVEFSVVDTQKGPKAVDVVRLNPPLEEEPIPEIVGGRKW